MKYRDYKMTPFYKLRYENVNGYNLFIKRDDLYPIIGGGNKGRKLDYILLDCLNKGCDAVVTCGGIQSNHNRATAIKCKELGLECTIIIHSNPIKKLSGNLKILELLGVNIVYCSLKNISSIMDNEMKILEKKGFKPYYIWGGGHSYEGTLAYFNAVKELRKQTEVNFDIVFLASGTGATQAGLHCGFKYYYPNTNVYGISVARKKEKGKIEIIKTIQHFISQNKLDNSYLEDVIFDDRFNCGGYEKTNIEQLNLIKHVAQKYGVILDPTYTSKAWMGMNYFMKNNILPANSNILFWHTGGLLNLMAQ
ncbi:1-aminocyclopropane-1-carboxylate deaminase/D-cysteine desulfhydrase [Proteus mirabilis]|uniref:1-aminocyclopropane-1-carboxylate deaminase/D-cysteine desulfhydrase n=1 Tax=Proteus mirabilis TaxID=584 RepID=UPI001A351173|nr:pyridoxal-phosphate dependent enzyme [Proteus mirabilis]MBI6319123.1 pyridoxal-phosphate dependent enzyme [Proteus mirabilis]HCT9026241.1 pyridoxal-phosphate dependent enzyme [Proteus mirabilis]HEJ9421305.1 pyridoxal-phosphate dependent enzyme [Proteus mirabilis]HEK1204572.1 pyridoxal-phosphate dependent enzyme [Proteus mirabilis]